MVFRILLIGAEFIQRQVNHIMHDITLNKRLPLLFTVRRHKNRDMDTRGWLLEAGAAAADPKKLMLARKTFHERQGEQATIATAT